MEGDGESGACYVFEDVALSQSSLRIDPQGSRAVWAPGPRAGGRLGLAEAGRHLHLVGFLPPAGCRLLACLGHGGGGAATFLGVLPHPPQVDRGLWRQLRPQVRVPGVERVLGLAQVGSPPQEGPIISGASFLFS